MRHTDGVGGVHYFLDCPRWQMINVYRPQIKFATIRYIFLFFFVLLCGYFYGVCWGKIIFTMLLHFYMKIKYYSELCWWMYERCWNINYY